VAAAGACIEDQQLAALSSDATDLGECRAAEDLGFLARYQRRRPGEELDAEEALPLGEVRERYACLLALQKLDQPLIGCCVELRQLRRRGARDGTLGRYGRAAGGTP